MSNLESKQLQALGTSGLSGMVACLRSTVLFHHALIWSLFRIIILF